MIEYPVWQDANENWQGANICNVGVIGALIKEEKKEEKKKDNQYKLNKAMASPLA